MGEMGPDSPREPHCRPQKSSRVPPGLSSVVASCVSVRPHMRRVRHRKCKQGAQGGGRAPTTLTLKRGPATGTPRETFHSWRALSAPNTAVEPVSRRPRVPRCGGALAGAPPAGPRRRGEGPRQHLRRGPKRPEGVEVGPGEGEDSHEIGFFSPPGCLGVVRARRTRRAFSLGPGGFF